MFSPCRWVCVVVSEKESSYSISHFIICKVLPVCFLQTQVVLSLCFSANPASSWIIFTSFSFHILQSFYLNLTMNCAPKLIPTKTDSGNCWAMPLMLFFHQHSHQIRFNIFPYLFPQLWHTESKDPPVCLYGHEFNYLCIWQSFDLQWFYCLKLKPATKKKWGIFKRAFLFEEIQIKGRSAAFYSKNLVVVWLLTADRYCHPVFRGKFCMLTAAGNGRREEAGFWGSFLNTRSEVTTSDSPSQTLNLGCDFSHQTRGLIPHLSRVVSSLEAPLVAYLCLCRSNAKPKNTIRSLI